MVLKVGTTHVTKIQTIVSLGLEGGFKKLATVEKLTLFDVQDRKTNFINCSQGIE